MSSNPPNDETSAGGTGAVPQHLYPSQYPSMAFVPSSPDTHSQNPSQGNHNSFPVPFNTVPMSYPPSMYPGQAVMPLVPMAPSGYDPRELLITSSERDCTELYQPGNPSSGSGAFTGAHNFTIGNATMVEQYISSGAPVFQYLQKKWSPGALADSSARPNPARCHPDTRKTVRSSICEWGLTSSTRRWRMFWVLGSAAVGKSALAQTIADRFKEEGCLGATFFFSRPNHRDDANTVIPTLAHQLAARNSHYRSIITELLVNDPAILDMNLSTQFKRLIIEPFHVIMTTHPESVTQPLLIILDGLDECRDRVDQRTLIELVGTHVRTVDNFPLIWMICSRPESHLRIMILNPHWNISCHREMLKVDEQEAQQDALRILERGFFDIQRTFEYQLDEDWPPEHYVGNIAAAASGHLGFVSFIIRFVADERANDPKGRLEKCIRFLDGFGAPGAISPLHALDLLYHQIFSEIPKEYLHHTMNILALFILYPDDKLSALQLANLMGLDQASFYRSLDSLYAVLDIPPPKEANARMLVMYHASLSDFLKDPRRSTRFCLNDDELHYQVGLRSLQILKHKSGGFDRTFKWIRSLEEEASILETLQNFAKKHVWKACCQTPARYFPNFVKELDGLNLDGISSSDDYNEFLRWKYYYNLN
ncbi:hypothetical protein NP233_g1386 [Leucocoprinus birnbaumii]|uniref:NACHT domain-containing protein n=1 Tax=Leucocoprinus birnbaumii TaxID=56174 RepID=A0AAD5W5M8_9AGAR|nr:hypothetical protein NP233_g1386 [Leucocoprinus birnbaumii]